MQAFCHLTFMLLRTPPAITAVALPASSTAAPTNYLPTAPPPLPYSYLWLCGWLTCQHAIPLGIYCAFTTVTGTVVATWTFFLHAFAGLHAMADHHLFVVYLFCYVLLLPLRALPCRPMRVVPARLVPMPQTCHTYRTPPPFHVVHGRHLLLHSSAAIPFSPVLYIPISLFTYMQPVHLFASFILIHSSCTSFAFYVHFCPFTFLLRYVSCSRVVAVLVLVLFRTPFWCWFQFFCWFSSFCTSFARTLYTPPPPLTYLYLYSIRHFTLHLYTF